MLKTASGLILPDGFLDPSPASSAVEAKAGGAPYTPNTDPLFNAQPRLWHGAGGGAGYAGVLTWRAIDLLAGYMRLAKTRWVPIDSDDEEAEYIDLPGTDPVSTLFKRPNLQMGWADFRYACETYRMLRGGWIAVKIGMDGSPTDRFPVSLLLYPITGWRRCAGTREIGDWRDYYRGDGWKNHQLNLVVKDTEAVVCQNFDPSMRNRAPAHAAFAAMAQEVMNSTQAYQRALLENDNRPGVVVTSSKTIKEDNRSRLQGEMMATYGGVVNAGRLMLLSGDSMDWKVNPIDPLKLTEISNMEHSRDLTRQIGAAFGVPEMVLVANLDNANKANAAEIMASFLVGTVEPNFGSFDALWRDQFFEPLGLSVRMKLDQWSLSAFRSVAADRMALVEARLKTGDTPEDAYRFAGIPFIKNKESGKPTLSSTIVQVQEPAPDAVQPEKPTTSGTEKPKEDRQDQAAAETRPKKSVAPAESKGIQSIQRVQASIKKVQSQTEARRRMLAERIFATCADPFEGAVKAATEKAFRHAKGETMKRLLTFLNTGHHLAKDARELQDRSLQIALKASDPIIPGLGDLDGLLPDGDALAGELRASWITSFLDVGTASVAQMESELGDVSRWTSKPLEDRRKPAMDRLADSVRVSETVRRDVKTTLSNILQADPGASVQQLARALREGVEDTFKDAFSRTTTIARTEVSGVLSGYRNGIMAANGVKRLRWVSAGDKHVRDSHVYLNGKTTDMGTPFEGSPLRWPHDVNAPAEEVINCRCVAVAA